MKKITAIGLLIYLLFFMCGCSLFNTEEPPNLDFGEPPAKHKWVYTVSLFKKDGGLDRTFISDVLPTWEDGVYTVYDGMCVEYKIRGNVEVYASESYDYSVPGEELPFPVCI